MKYPGILFLMLLFLQGSTMAQETVWKADFRGPLPGMPPEEWKCLWGTMGDDLVIISNVNTLSGRAMEIDRSGSNPGMWAYGTKTADVPEGTAIFHIPFRLEDGGVNAAFGIEIGTRKGRYLAIGFQKRHVRIFNSKWKLIADLGTFQMKKWYRIVLRLPTRGSGREKGCGRLEVFENGSFQQKERAVTFHLPVPSAPYGTFLFVVNPPRKDGRRFKVCFDRLELLHAP